jgi:hypothetical protein
MANFHYATPLSCATYAEAFNCAMLVNHGGALRWMKESLTEPHELVKTKIRPLEVWQLPVAMCNHPHYMTSRLLDVNILFLLQIAHDLGLFEKATTIQKGARVEFSDKLF